jgi:UDP-N-acetylglucosamine acyltransferase
MISPLAHINPGARIGNDVRIDPFAVIHEEVSIGDGSHIMSNAVLLPGTQIGKECLVYPGAVIGGIPQDLKFVGEKTTVEIGDHTTIRECVTINRGTKDKFKTVIGSHCLIMAYAHIAHDCILGDHVILANAVQLAGHVQVGDYAIIGGLAGASQFARIGAHTYIAGQSAISKDVPPYIKAGKSPLGFVGINSVGLKRRGFSSETINGILNVYRMLFYKNMNTSQAMASIEQEIPAFTERDLILSFIRESSRGIIRSSGDENADEE